MKNFSFGFLICFILGSCANTETVKDVLHVMRDFASRSYDFCTEGHIQGTRVINGKTVPAYVGKLCYTGCDKYKQIFNKDECKKNKGNMDVKDLLDPATYEKFSSGDWRVIPPNLQD